jgi:hypothetical protein
MAREGEVARFQHVTEMLHGLVDSQQLSIVGVVFLLGRVEILGGQPLSTRCCNTAPMAEVEASVTSASGAAWLECPSRVTRDKLALLSSKALWRPGVQESGREPLTLGPESVM